jgi:hypothetical protein
LELWTRATRDTQLAFSLWACHALPAERLRDVAATMLEQSDSKSLRLLAGAADNEPSLELTSLFSAALAENGLTLPAAEDGIRSIANLVSTMILRDEVDPYVGARYLMELSREVRPHFHDVDPFIYAASEYEDRPSDRSHFSEEIRAQAERWLNRQERPQTR